jgi:hypothetical protein
MAGLARGGAHIKPGYEVCFQARAAWKQRAGCGERRWGRHVRRRHVRRRHVRRRHVRRRHVNAGRHHGRVPHRVAGRCHVYRGARGRWHGCRRQEWRRGDDRSAGRGCGVRHKQVGGERLMAAAAETVGFFLERPEAVLEEQPAEKVEVRVGRAERFAYRPPTQ